MLRITMDETKIEMPVAQNDVKIKEERYDPEIEQKINDIEKKVMIGLNGDVQTVKLEQPEENSSDNDSDSSDGTEVDAEPETEEKKSIEPVKSSNEILMELFKVFNAAPPEELLNDDNLLKNKKQKKHHKKERKKKKKKSKSEFKYEPGVKAEESDTSVATSGDSFNHLEKKGKHKKHKKHKHKSEKSKDKVKDKGKSKSTEKAKSKERDKNKETGRRTNLSIKEEPVERVKTDNDSSTPRSRKRTAVDTSDTAQIKRKPISFTVQSTSSRSRERSRECDKGNHNFYNGYRENSSSDHRSSRNEFKSHSYNSNDIKIKKEQVDLYSDPKSRKLRNKEDAHISEISLSDEETYLKERNTVDLRRKDIKSILSASRYKTRNAFYDGVDRQNSREERRRHHSFRRRSRSRSRDLGIDKKRLLEIARKNAISMFKRGNLPGCADMSEEVKDKVLLKMRYGGRTVQDLTEFCKKLSNGENLNDISDLSSDEDSDVDKQGNAKAFNHPFMIKEREPIVMHIRGSAPISTIKKGEDLTKAITLQFPVSSGQQHRLTEAWVPVETKESLAPLPALPVAAQSTTLFKSSKPDVQKNVFQNTVPKNIEQEPAFKITNAESSAITIPVTEKLADATSSTLATIPTPVVPVGIPTTVPTPFVPDVPIPSAAPSSDSVFPQVEAPSLDVSSIISKRLNAMRRLQENPMDSEALKMMYNSQREMTSWASSKHVPGQFTGSTGANVLSAKELSAGPQVWARRDQLTSTVPMTGGMGMHLLKKMGWKPGEGLGREKTGSLQPLLLDVKLDKRGLVSEEDNSNKRQQMTKKRRHNNMAEVQQSLKDKHPVSLLNELTSKRKWTPPLYELVSEGGPSHSKMFMFSVSINGQTFVPDKGSNTKKDAKVIAARHCLQQIGIIPQ